MKIKFCPLCGTTIKKHVNTQSKKLVCTQCANPECAEVFISLKVKTKYGKKLSIAII